jgi:hypothetical protein
MSFPLSTLRFTRFSSDSQQYDSLEWQGTNLTSIIGNLFSSNLIANPINIIDIALGSKEQKSFVAYSFRNYDYSSDTEADIFFLYLMQDLLFHPKMIIIIINLNV